MDLKHFDPLFQGRSRTRTLRIKGWDYSSPAVYHITLCTKNRIPHFGIIQNGKMHLSDIGESANENWIAIPDHFPCVSLDVHQVMPDHLHGIVGVNMRPEDLPVACSVNQDGSVETVFSVETRHGASLQKNSLLNNPSTSLQKNPQEHTNRFGPLKPGSLQSAINHYKGSVTRQCRENDFPSFAWQPRYFEQRIRTMEELEKMRQYIRENPKHWKEINDDKEVY